MNSDILVPLSLPKARRVIRSSEFRDIYRRGIRITSRFFVVFCLSAGSGQELSRFGFTVPRALGKAVRRNKIKRRMREAVRLQVDSVPAGWTIVFNPRRSVLDTPFVELCGEIKRVLAKCEKSSSVS